MALFLALLVLVGIVAIAHLVYAGKTPTQREEDGNRSGRFGRWL